MRHALVLPLVLLAACADVTVEEGGFYVDPEIALPDGSVHRVGYMRPHLAVTRRSAPWGEGDQDLAFAAAARHCAARSTALVSEAEPGGWLDREGVWFLTAACVPEAEADVPLCFPGQECERSGEDTSPPVLVSGALNRD